MTFDPDHDHRLDDVASASPREPDVAEPGTGEVRPEDGRETSYSELASVTPSVRDLEAGEAMAASVPISPVRRRPALSPAVAFAGGGLLALVGVVSLVLAVTGLVKPSQAVVAASPPPPAVALASPAIVTPVDLANGRTLGLATAPVKVEVWEDFQCPICARWNATVKEQLIANYVKPGKVQLTYRDFIVIGRESIVAAIAARIAEREGQFWPYADRLFANQIGENTGSFAPARLVAIAAALHLDWQKFQTALLNETEDPATIQVLQANQDEGTKLGITGTPSIVVNGTLLQKNDWPTISAAIDKALAGK